MLFNPLQGSFYLNNFLSNRNLISYCFALLAFILSTFVMKGAQSCHQHAHSFTFTYSITYLFNHLFIYLPTISLNYIFLTTLTVFFVYYGFNLLLFHEWIEISFIVWRINGHFKSYTM